MGKFRQFATFLGFDLGVEPDFRGLDGVRNGFVFSNCCWLGWLWVRFFKSQDVAGAGGCREAEIPAVVQVAVGLETAQFHGVAADGGVETVAVFAAGVENFFGEGGFVDGCQMREAPGVAEDLGGEVEFEEAFGTELGLRFGGEGEVFGRIADYFVV